MDSFHYSRSLCSCNIETAMIENPLIRTEMTVVVMGLGVSGRAAVKYLNACGARVFVSDSRPLEKLSSTEIRLITDCCSGYEGGEHTESFIGQAELIFISPGISLNLEVLQKPAQQKIPIVGELALAAPVLENKMVAITGTNGKTTVTTLIGEFIKGSDRTAFVGGNIGRPLFEYLMDEQTADILVVEVSSFQLELAGDFRPDVAVLLNITPDHLDRHGNLAEYIRTKANIFTAQDSDNFAIIGGDDHLCREVAGQLKKRGTLLFGYRKDCHAYIDNSQIIVSWKGVTEEYHLEDTVFNNHIGRLNSAAAILAARALGVERLSIQQGLANFQLLPHRMQIVDEIDGVLYCNDSKATNTGAVLSALQQIEGKVILIAGGRDKGDDYRLLKNTAKQKVKKLVLIGEAAKQIEIQLDGAAEIEHAKSMAEAVDIAEKTAVTGDTVLLSPACASFDMFDSYGHRGESFIYAVQQLKAGSISAET